MCTTLGLFLSSGHEENMWVVRKATSLDAAKLAELVNLAYRVDNNGWTNEFKFVSGLRTTEQALLENEFKNDTVLIAEEDGKLIGSVAIHNIDFKRYSLGMVSVHPAMQNRKLGRHLLESAEQWIASREDGVVVEMTVMEPRLELISWYERRGYRIRTDLPRIPFPPLEAGVGTPLEANICFVYMEKTL